MSSVFQSYTPVAWRETKRHSLGFYQELLTNQFSSLPYFLAKCEVPHFCSTVEQLLGRQHFDVLFCDFLHTAAPLRMIDFKPKVVFEHNVEFLLRKRKWELEKRPLQRFVLGTEWKRTQRIESQVCRSFEHVIAVSTDDQNSLRHEFAIDQVSIVPTGVDAEFFCPIGNSSQPGHLAFVGSMDWDPNEDGIAWFVREVYPQILRKVPNASLSIVGRNPSSRLRAIVSHEPSIEITGWVADVRPYLAQAEVVVVPLRVGSGTRIKIPEAMAMQKAVVSTSIGAEGLPFRDGHEIRIADESKDFAQSVSELLQNRSLRHRLAATAREAVVREHCWQAVVEKVEQVLEQLNKSEAHAIAA